MDTGFEIQIDEEARGDSRIAEPDGLFFNRTGAIYKARTPGTGPGKQNYTNAQVLNAGQWNRYEIAFAGNTLSVVLNGQLATTFENSDGFRGKSPGFIGLQVHTGRVAFANIRLA